MILIGGEVDTEMLLSHSLEVIGGTYLDNGSAFIPKSLAKPVQ